MVKSINGKSKKPSYRCPRNVGAAACGGTTIVAAETESWVIEAALRLHDVSVLKQSSDSEEWLEKSGALDARLEELAGDYGTGTISRGEWMAAKSAIERAKAALPVPVMRPPKLSTGEMVRDSWEDMPVSARRAILDAVFVKIVVLPRRQITGLKAFDPDRLSPEWWR